MGQKALCSVLLDSYPGSMGRRGSPPSTQNPSSFSATMGSGLLDDPAIMLVKNNHMSE